MSEDAAPELLTADLQPAEARELIARILRDAQVRAVRESGGRRSSTPDAAEVTAACERLLGGATQRLQVHYAFEGAEWIDTYLALGGQTGGLRLVRVRGSAGVPPASSGAP